MSDSDSFIEEVSEEVRRDRLYHLARRYGWIVALVLVAVVGGAAWNEWRKATNQAEAEAFGDALIAALDGPDEEARARALSGSLGPPEAAPALSLLLAADRLTAEDPGTAAQALQTLSEDASVDRVYSDLAGLKLVLLGDDGVSVEARGALLDRLATPGAPYRALAMEQQAIAFAAAGDVDAARTRAEEVLDEPGLTQPMVQRVAQLLIVLGPSEDASGEDGQ